MRFMNAWSQPWARAALGAAVMGAFALLFLVSWDGNWAAKYQRWSVPAFSYPGGDARNIQVAADCARQGYALFGENPCLARAAVVKAIYPEAVVPELNYPSIWPHVYGWFGDSSERFFHWFWVFNACALVLGLVVLAMRYQVVLLPWLVFSPISLLAIERGNIDAIVFAVTFLPVLLLDVKAAWWRDVLKGFFLGLSSALKVFPVFGFLAALGRHRPFVSWGVMAGGLCAAPLLWHSLQEVHHFVAGTSKGFEIAYGLSSLRYEPHFGDHPRLALLAMSAYVLLAVVCLVLSLRRADWVHEADTQLQTLDARARWVLKVSLAIYLATFFLTTSWAYRLIFLMPALVVLSSLRGGGARLLTVMGLAMLWLPMLPFGWMLQNLACYALTLPALFVAVRLFWLPPAGVNPM